MTPRFQRKGKRVRYSLNDGKTWIEAKSRINGVTGSVQVNVDGKIFTLESKVPKEELRLLFPEHQSREAPERKRDPSILPNATPRTSPWLKEEEKLKKIVKRVGRPTSVRMGDEVLAALQERYGDETTAKEVQDKIHGPRMEFDKKELYSRWNRATNGYELPPTMNPLIHLGKDMKGMITGGKQVLKNIVPKSLQKDWDKDIEDYFTEHKAWTAAQGLPEELVGTLGSTALLGLGYPLSTPARMHMMAASKNPINRAMTRDLALSGARTSPQVPVGTAAVEGGAMGFLQPVDPASENPLMDRTINTLVGGGAGAGFGLVGQKLGAYHQRKLTDRLKRDLQRDLPHPIEATPPDLYNYQTGGDRLRALAARTDPGATTEGAKTLHGKYKESLMKNFDAMNLNMTGSTNQKVGVSITPVMNKYKEQAEESWKHVNKAYERAKATGNLYGKGSYLDDLVDKIDYELTGEILPKQDITLSAYTRFKQIPKMLDQNGNEIFDVKELTAIYQGLNKRLGKAEGLDKEAIHVMKRNIVEFMDKAMKNPQRMLNGDRTVIKKFQDATKLAHKHYQTYTRDNRVDDFLTGQISPEDISIQLFGGTSMSPTAKPKIDTINQIKSVMGKDGESALKNEVYAHMSTEFGEKKLPHVLTSMKKYLDKTETVTTLFDEDELGKWRDYINAVDFVENTTDFNRDGGKLEKILNFEMNPLSKPLKSLANKFSDGAASDYTLVRRALDNRVFPSGDLTKQVGVPGAFGALSVNAKMDAERDLMKGLLVMDPESEDVNM